MAERHVALDALRGVAVMGIVLMNIIAFAMPEGAYSNPIAYGGDTYVDLASWAIAFVLVDGKMRALFSFLFGASILLVVERARGAGRNGSKVHAARMAVLFVIGALHFTLLWWGDILHHYALVGLFALAFIQASQRTLVTLAVAAFAVTIALDIPTAVYMEALERQATSGAGDTSAEIVWASVTDRIGVPSPAALVGQFDAVLAPYSQVVAHRLTGELSRVLGGLFDFGLETLGLMLLGMWALRSGFVTGTWDPDRYRRVMTICYAIGLPPLVALAANSWRSEFDPLTVYLASQLYAAPFRPVVMLGHAAAVLFLIARSGPPERLVAVGRVAFTNYLATSIVMTTLFYGYGLGLFGDLSRAEAYLVALAAALLMLAWSKPWLDRYRHGPAEWLWRSLSRWERQPMRRS